MNSVSVTNQSEPVMSEVEDDQVLLARVKGGDKAAFATLYDRHASLLLGIAHRCLQNRGEAEDLLHDVFLEAWQKVASYDPGRGTVRSWLVTRVRSRAIDRQRSLAVARKHAMVSSPDRLEFKPSDEDVSQTPDQVRARRALAQLTPEQRMVVELSYFEGLTCREVAERCRIPVGTAKSRLSAALVVLRNELNAVGAPG